ncbi:MULTISPECIES: GNAT family N-acetyltransferase [Streptomyces]|uniref:GNAT family N-acetyltransferase n=1 Tax=Streptomyces TaxID=1883 RepID=UPI001677FD01|nr:GNAT family protein [Streptomyces thermoviolaceus]WTD46693.1 GNAT family N-acetyltransferase [Streptomyces thermoviolaceus]GGV77432.1 acetyltransferase [Streptomyces thermoviolaceus subsp. apingens]
MAHTTARWLAEGPRVGIRPFTLEDGEEFTARVRESKGLHQPWLFPPDTAEAYAAYAGRLIDDPAKAGFLVCEKTGGDIAGFININNIVHGAFQCGALGYGAFAHAAGRGLMKEGLNLVVDHAFGPMGLHRLEINVQPGNAASIGLARSCGFRLEGYSPQMLYVAGAWRDHERWALTAEMRRSGRPGPPRTGGTDGR